MRMSTRLRRLMRLVPWPTLLLFGCGGDKDPTGPGNPATTGFELVSIGRVGLPADTQLEDCVATRFYGGELEVVDDGTWRIRLRVHDDLAGDWPYLDEGEGWEDDGGLWFESQYSGAIYQGTWEGSEVKVMYDWCFNGVPDVQLVFDR